MVPGEWKQDVEALHLCPGRNHLENDAAWLQLKGSELGPLTGIDDKIVWWIAPDPNTSHKAPENQTMHPFAHPHRAQDLMQPQRGRKRL